MRNTKVSVTKSFFILWIICVMIFVFTLILGTDFLRHMVTETTFGKSTLFNWLLIGSVAVGVLSFGCGIVSIVLTDIIRRKSLKALIIFLILPLSLMAGLFLFIRLSNSNSGANIVSNIISLAIQSPGPTLPPSQVKSEVIRLVNNERTRNGLPSLKESSSLDKSAQLKLDDMIANKYFDHVSPQGTPPWYFFKKVGYIYGRAGENLAEGQISASSAVIAWMNSQVHKEDILDSRYVDTGVAVAYTDGALTIVQHFGVPVSGISNATLTDPNKVPSRTGDIISYHDWCNNKDTSVYENEIIVKKSSDGNIYGMTVDDWNCYEKFLISTK